MYRTKNEILTFPSSVWLPGVEWYLGAWTATTSHAAWDGRWPKATAKSKVFLKKIRKKKVNTKCKERKESYEENTVKIMKNVYVGYIIPPYDLSSNTNK